MRILVTLILVALCHGLAAPAAAQAPPNRDRARVPYGLGVEHMRSESWEEAARYFQQAIDIDEEFDLAYYMLGRTNMSLRRYVAAIAAYTKCRDLYEAQAGRRFSSSQDAQRYRQDRMLELDELARQLQTGRQTDRSAEQLRQISEQRRQIQDAISRGSNLTIDATVPAWVSLALGSAHFRAGHLAEAERAYKAAIAADGRAGEAHNNLAVVFLETGRYAEAEAALKSAKKAGFRVNPDLEQDIRNRRKSGQ